VYYFNSMSGELEAIISYSANFGGSAGCLAGPSLLDVPVCMGGAMTCGVNQDAGVTDAGPPDCRSFADEASCQAHAGQGCRVDGCPNCGGGSTFAQCSNPGTAPISCSPPLCPPCSMLERPACDANTACHSVF